MQQLVDKREDDYGNLSVRLGLALGAHDAPEEVERFDAQFDFVQVMGIEREGRQGEPFDPDKKALYLVERLRARKVIQRPEDLGISPLDATRQLLAARSVQDLVACSGGLYRPPAKFRNW